MECKVARYDVVFGVVLDLIDTLWNVKFGFRSLSYVIIIDLIDTLWNVKSRFICFV